jgi:hypothetical protein
MKLRMIVFLNLSILCSPIYSDQQLPLPDLSLKKDTVWTVAFAAFKGKNLSRENDHLVRSLPLLVKGELDEIHKHYFTADAKEEYRKTIINNELKNQYTQLLQLEKSKDDFFFENQNTPDAAKRLDDLKTNISKRNDLIARIKAYDDSQIVFPDEMPVSYLSTEKNETLFDAPRFSPLQYVIDKNINLLVYGDVEEVQGYLMITVQALERSFEKIVFTASKVVAADEISSFAEEIKNGLARAIMGSDWGSLTVTTGNPKSILYINDEFAGIGNFRLTYIKPGEKKIHIEAPGYLSQEKTITLIADEDTKLTFKLEKQELAKVRLNSDPSGANVYIDSEWAGKTPLDIEKTDAMQRVLLKMNDYDDYSFHIDQSTKAELSITLVKHTIDLNARQSAARDSFYGSFGFFLVSIAFPIFLSGYSQDFLAAAKAPGSDFDKYVLYSNICNVSYWSTFAISGGLLVLTIINLIQYIGASDRPIG